MRVVSFRVNLKLILIPVQYPFYTHTRFYLDIYRTVYFKSSISRLHLIPFVPELELSKISVRLKSRTWTVLVKLYAAVIFRWQESAPKFWKIDGKFLSFKTEAGVRTRYLRRIRKLALNEMRVCCDGLERSESSGTLI